jgi:iron-sulfur cluster assembly protein|tara:strand:- start:1505 stop:1903 length:399 start_codon:yes stop_codon:yes gene_type:complete
MHWLNKDNFGMSVMFQFEPGKAPITLTEAAVDRAKVLMEKSGDDKILGLRVGVKTTGCSGLSYFVEYAKEQKKFEDKVEENGITLFIDPTAIMFIIGSEMDYKEDKMSSGFVFNNPNEISRCGCGESFSVKQ